MDIPTLNQNPVAGSSTFGPFAESKADSPAKAGKAVFDKLTTYQSADTPAAVPARVKRDTTDFIIKDVGDSLESIVNSDRVRGELDKMIETLKGMNVREVEIKSYFPLFKERAQPRANAVAAYLVLKGVDKAIITKTPRGPGYGNKDSGLAREKAVRIEIHGSPKANAASEEPTLVPTRSVRYLLA